ncbi:MAG: alpha/beta hydrolase [Allomuricauda sp.]|uniref:alpha/beta fold hydrolase n=1 Tax=Flagellimonas lutimaris TaxID=475082 RepID=UPI00334D3779|tara:strand:+ start:504 stop:1517 length:1014 start_codon:yes stop_codon:yes gene_type:complete
MDKITNSLLKTLILGTMFFSVLSMFAIPSPRKQNQGETTILKHVKHGYVNSGGVNIHYAELGNGPLVVMIHGFPDYWYTWRNQMAVLSKKYHVVAIDQRGYNKSDKPIGVENYTMKKLVGDVAAVIHHFKQEKAIIIGHDWGGAVAWQFAINLPDMTDKLIILNITHPNGMLRELANNPTQQESSSYARKFIDGTVEDPTILFGKPMTAENLAFWVEDSVTRIQYVSAFKRSSFDAMLNFYKANYTREPYMEEWKKAQENPLPKLKMPLLIFHGLEDAAINANGLNNTWEWVEKDMTLVTVPGSGHFIQQDASEFVTKTMKSWLNLQTELNRAYDRG